MKVDLQKGIVQVGEPIEKPTSNQKCKYCYGIRFSDLKHLNQST